MTDTINTGGAAFPNAVPEHYEWAGDGMTLRDYFAAKTEVPWNAVFETLAMQGEHNPTIQRVVNYRAQIKYLEADAMIAARGGAL